ncbi:MAG: LuxR C-terminal-related transcriptional regulator, partial [Coriobacteriales bacterium]|nr:LuxR C-terminal-related transcriptional regulator [Coriobacteriales bacterium]
GEWLGPCLIGIGILLIVPDLSQGSLPHMVSLILSSLGTGAGSALVLLDVGRAYSFVGRKACALEVLIATMAAALIALSLFFLPFSAVLGVVLLMPFLTVCCLKKSQSSMQATTKRRASRGEKLTGSMMVRFTLMAFILGTVTGFMRDIYSLHGDDVFGFSYALLFSIGAFLAAVILGVAIFFAKYFSIKTLYKPVILLCAIGFAVIPALGIGMPFPFLIVSIGYTLFEILIWVILSEVAKRFQYTSVQVFGFGRSLVLAGGIIIGILLSRVLSNIDVLDMQTLVFISAIAVSLIIVSQNYILTDHVLETFEGNPRNEPYEPLASRTDTKDAHPSATEEGSPTERRTRIPLRARCQLIGEYYKLSAREIDVFHLLACGRNAARVQEELIISPGTVNTHTRHIYQKLDIHTQQELIDLMQTADLDAVSNELGKRKRSKR